MNRPSIQVTWFNARTAGPFLGTCSFLLTRNPYRGARTRHTSGWISHGKKATNATKATKAEARAINRISIGDMDREPSGR
jgi:hypothetical protein